MCMNATQPVASSWSTVCSETNNCGCIKKAIRGWLGLIKLQGKPIQCEEAGERTLDNLKTAARTVILFTASNKKHHCDNIWLNNSACSYLCAFTYYLPKVANDNVNIRKTNFPVHAVQFLWKRKQDCRCKNSFKLIFRAFWVSANTAINIQSW